MDNIRTEIKKSSNTLDILFQVLRVILYIGFGIMATSIIYVAFIGVRNIDGVLIHSGLSIGGDFVNSIEDLKANAPKISFILIWMVLLQIVFYRIGAMFHDIRETASPFTIKNVERIRFCAFVLLAAAILPNLAEIVLAFIIEGADCDVEIINLAVLALAPVMLGLSKIFAYGMQLQQQDDETL
jgi:hypothetical protein